MFIVYDLTSDEIFLAVSGDHTIDEVLPTFAGFGSFNTEENADVILRPGNYKVGNPASIFISDAFAKPDDATSLGTTETGGKTWVNLSGIFGVIGARAYLATNSGGSGSNLAVFDSGSSDGEFSVKFFSVFDEMGIAFRVDDATNFLRVDFDQPTSTWTVRTIIAGVPTTLGQFVQAVVDGDELAVNCSMSTLKFIFNGVLQSTLTSTFNQTESKFGLWQKDGLFGQRYDDVVFDTLSFLVPKVPPPFELVDIPQAPGDVSAIRRGDYAVVRWDRVTRDSHDMPLPVSVTQYIVQRRTHSGVLDNIVAVVNSDVASGEKFINGIGQGDPGPDVKFVSYSNFNSNLVIDQVSNDLTQSLATASTDDLSAFTNIGQSFTAGYDNLMKVSVFVNRVGGFDVDLRVKIRLDSFSSSDVLSFVVPSASIPITAAPSKLDIILPSQVKTFPGQLVFAIFSQENSTGDDIFLAYDDPGFYSDMRPVFIDVFDISSPDNFFYVVSAMMSGDTSAAVVSQVSVERMGVHFPQISDGIKERVSDFALTGFQLDVSGLDDDSQALI